MHRIQIMTFETSTNTLDAISADVAIVFALSKKKGESVTYDPLASFTQLDSTLNGQLTKAVTIEQFKGKKGQIVSIIPQNNIAPSRVVVIGLGEKKELVLDDIRNVMGSFAKKMRISIDSASIVIPSKNEIGFDNPEVIFHIAEGLLLGTYTFNKYKKVEKNDREFATFIFAQQEKQREVKDIVEKARLYFDATKLARDLVNEQPAIATPTFLAKLAQDIAKSSPQISCTIYDKPQLEKMGMEAFLGIARAADTPPKFIHLEYTPEKTSSKEKLAIVGKGITFDSGGINVKPGDHMMDMKMDMSGGAAVLGIFSVIAKIEPSFPVVGLIAATPNLISGTSLVPGDVVRAYNGKTIEVLNTDAEGRVTMADSLSYAVKQGATRIVDFATLTGACMVALGEDITGLFANNKEFADDIKNAAAYEGEKVWELPLEKTYKKLNKSEVADIANIPSSRYGGAVTAALFLEEFVDNKPWVHMDIAGPAFSSKGSDLGPKGATGFGVRMILRLLEKLKN